MPDYRRRAVRESMTVRLDVNGIMSEAIGEEGFGRGEVDALARRAEELAHGLHERREGGELPFLDLHKRQDLLKSVMALAADVREEADTFVVLGIGGSALGTRTILNAVGTDRIPVHVADNVDPWSFGTLLEGLDLSRTVFNVISKSGETAETMSQFLFVRDRLLRALGAIEYKKHIVITTAPEGGYLRQIVNDEGFRDLIVPPGVGGRYSVLSPVGLFPAAVAGVRVDELLAGAAWMDARSQSHVLWENPSYLFGALLYLAEVRKKKNVVVLMPYSDRLRELAAWFAQLWAESLGKARDLDDKPVHVGQTPQAALGVTDQHSQVQLYLEGPHDKVVVMIRVEDHGRALEIPTAYADLEGVSYLGGTEFGALCNMEQRATELALQKHGRMVLTLKVPEVNAFALGQLFQLFEAATLFAGALHRINPLDQPAVEEGKRLTYGLAGRKGWEDRRTEVEQWLAGKRTEYVL
jgi:glucose-6-phosphate isomerase